MSEANKAIGIVLLLIFGPPLLFVFPMMVIALVGTAFSPIAGIISGWLAHRRGLNVKRFTVIGVVYSIMLAVPCLFLVFGLRGWNMSRRLIRRIYIFLYVEWFGINVLMCFGTFVAGPESIRIAALLIAVASAGGWLMSMSALQRVEVSPLAKWGSPGKGIVPYAGYVQPFAGTTLMIAAYLLIYLLDRYIL